jgi:preprotein translocase subunit SecA
MGQVLPHNPAAESIASDTTSPLPIPTAMWRRLAANQQPPKLLKGLDAVWAAIEGKLRQALPRRRLALHFADRVIALQSRFESFSDDQLRQAAANQRVAFRLGRDQTHDLVEAFGIIREVATRQLGLRLYRVQLAAGFSMTRGHVAELATGEGKTLVATLPATIGGWRAHGCHVITVNDYLAKRDAEEMGPVYQFCGLSVAAIDQETEPPERRAAYAADITYLTNKEVAADYLRDRLALGDTRSLPHALLDDLTNAQPTRALDRVVMRGLSIAIIDEADSVMIDESVTPLIISGDSPNAEQTEAFQTAATLAEPLQTPEHYKVNAKWREVRLTPEGRRVLDEQCADMGGLWTGRRRREELVHQALTARELFLKDQQYVIQEDKVVIVDESTGRLMPDRTWRDGLHQAVEAKEGLEIQPPKQTLARVSFQKFFRLYNHLCGMTGTAAESTAELWQIYRQPVTRIPTHRPIIRTQQRDQLFASADAKWTAVLAAVQTRHATGQPVLIGTRSVEASETVSTLLSDAGLKHEVLNAVKHEAEAQIVAIAGERDRITVATNMAGRGTDIKLGDGVPELGGLHVIATERHETSRIDRQLYGRAGRQGDHGSVEVFSCLEDELFQRHGSRIFKRLIRPFCIGQSSARGLLVDLMRRQAQQKAERMARSQRRSVLQTDDWLEEQLAFARLE